MSNFDLFCLAFGAIACAVLYFVLKHRVHIHIAYQSRGQEPRRTATAEQMPAARQAARAARANRKAGDDGPLQFTQAPRTTSRVVNLPSGARGSFDSVVWGDLTSALINLGCKEKRARQIVSRLQAEAPKEEFDALLRRAIKEAA